MVMDLAKSERGAEKKLPLACYYLKGDLPPNNRSNYYIRIVGENNYA